MLPLYMILRTANQLHGYQVGVLDHGLAREPYYRPATDGDVPDGEDNYPTHVNDVYLKIHRWLMAMK